MLKTGFGRDIILTLLLRLYVWLRSCLKKVKQLSKTFIFYFVWVPLFIIQCILMIQASQSEQRNDDKIDANGQITILIALMSKKRNYEFSLLLQYLYWASLLGFLLNIITFIANAFNTYEEQMQVFV